MKEQIRAAFLANHQRNSEALHAYVLARTDAERTAIVKRLG